MNTRDFLNALAPHQDRALIFSLGHEPIRPGYHVTEIKAVSVQGVDCGGQADAWAETVIQLWTPNTADETYMSVSKFLSICRRVASQIPVEEGAEVRLEYGEQGAPAVSYFVGEVRREGEEVVVRLEPPFVTCKANARLGLAQSQVEGLPVVSAASDCCTPASAQKSIEQKPAEQTTCCG